MLAYDSTFQLRIYAKPNFRPYVAVHGSHAGVQYVLDKASDATPFTVNSRFNPTTGVLVWRFSWDDNGVTRYIHVDTDRNFWVVAGVTDSARAASFCVELAKGDHDGFPVLNEGYIRIRLSYKFARMNRFLQFEGGDDFDDNSKLYGYFTEDDLDDGHQSELRIEALSEASRQELIGQLWRFAQFRRPVAR